MQQNFIENEENIHCCVDHNLPIKMVLCDLNCNSNKRLLCSDCLKSTKQDANLLSYEQVLENIQENKQQKKLFSDNQILIIVNMIEELQKQFHQVKYKMVQQIDLIIGNIDEWIKNLYQISQQSLTYSLYGEINKLIRQKQDFQSEEQTIIDLISSVNNSWNKKIMLKLNQLKTQQNFQIHETILDNIINIYKIKTEQTRYNQQQQQQLGQIIQLKQETQNQIKQELPKNEQMILKLIDDSTQQSGSCLVIAFNKIGSIMVSSSYEKIIIWDFQKGKFQLFKKYQVHSDSVRCLVYSKKYNNFISGSSDFTIICWKQSDNKNWLYSTPYKQHNNYVMCMMLNQQENELVSGGRDNSIKVWKVDFLQNSLTFQYSLDRHTNQVISLGLNSQESILASSQISGFIVWEKNQNGRWDFSYSKSVKTGRKIILNERHLLWVTEDRNADVVLVFEFQNGVLSLNEKKTINLIKNSSCDDEILFPIVYNKEKKLFLIRHKYHIYLVKELNDLNFDIVVQLNCKFDYTFGTMTDDAKYLVFWDGQQEKYLSFEIQQQ